MTERAARDTRLKDAEKLPPSTKTREKIRSPLHSGSIFRTSIGRINSLEKSSIGGVEIAA